MLLSFSNNLLAQLSEKRLVFTVTTGRSGTGFLAKILDFLPAVTSVHEPEPEFSDVMRLVQTEPDEAEKFWLEKKLPQIARVPGRIYVETSHLACKGFLEPLASLGLVPDLIFLNRPHRDTATSLFQLRTIPGRTEKAFRYYLNPNDPGVLPLVGWENLHDYQLCYWYCLEIERRQRLYQEQFEPLGAKVVGITLDDLNTAKGMRRLLVSLDLPDRSPVFWLRWRMHRSKKVNTKTTMKQQADLPGNLRELEEEVEALVRRPS